MTFWGKKSSKARLKGAFEQKVFSVRYGDP
jgi:hypothetical protein